MCIHYLCLVKKKKALFQYADDENLTVTHSCFCFFRGCVSHELQGSKEPSYIRSIHHIQVQTHPHTTYMCVQRLPLKTAWQVLVRSHLFCLFVARRSEGTDINWTDNRPRQVISSVFEKHTRFIFPFRSSSVSQPLSHTFICNSLTILNYMAGCERPSVPPSNSQTAIPVP